MMKRRRRRRNIVYRLKKPNIKKWKRLIILVTVVFGLVQGLRFLYGSVYAVVLDYASVQTVNLATLVIKEGLAQSELMDYSIDELILFKEDGNGNVSEMVINTPIINRLLVSTTAKVQEKLLLIEMGRMDHLGLEKFEEGPFQEGVLFQVPWAAAFNMSLFHDIGPTFPVSVRIDGNAVTEIVRNIEPYGINNAMLEVALNVRVNMFVTLPFRSEEVSVEVTTPLVLKTITGEIPQYYFIGDGEVWPGNSIIGE